MNSYLGYRDPETDWRVRIGRFQSNFNLPVVATEKVSTATMPPVSVLAGPMESIWKCRSWKAGESI